MGLPSVLYCISPYKLSVLEPRCSTSIGKLLFLFSEKDVEKEIDTARWEWPRKRLYLYSIRFGNIDGLGHVRQGDEVVWYTRRPISVFSRQIVIA